MSIPKQTLLLLLGIVMMIFSMGFQKNKTKEAEIQALIDAKVASKVEEFRRIRLEKCRERILERAGELADSIIIATAINTINFDSINRPIPPERPMRPAIKPPLDTTPVAPFFQVDTFQ